MTDLEELRDHLIGEMKDLRQSARGSRGQIDTLGGVGSGNLAVQHFESAKRYDDAADMFARYLAAVDRVIADAGAVQRGGFDLHYVLGIAKRAAGMQNNGIALLGTGSRESVIEIIESAEKIIHRIVR